MVAYVMNTRNRHTHTNEIKHYTFSQYVPLFIFIEVFVDSEMAVVAGVVRN